MKNRYKSALSYPVEPIFADACGNTFIIFDCLTHAFTSKGWEEFKQEVWKLLPDAGVDDALVLRKIEANTQMTSIKMHVLEPDGTEADFCGNGARAVGMFLYQYHEAARKNFCLVSRRGTHRFIYANGECFVEMGTPLIAAGDLSFAFRSAALKLQLVDCVEPHLVTADFFDAELLTALGQEINLQWRERFPGGVNVNCYRHVNRETLEVLTYERGVYRITAACGTGSTACTKVAIDQNYIGCLQDVVIKVLGGNLAVRQTNDIFWLGGGVTLN